MKIFFKMINLTEFDKELVNQPYILIFCIDITIFKTYINLWESQNMSELNKIEVSQNRPAFCDTY